MGLLKSAFLTEGIYFKLVVVSWRNFYHEFFLSYNFKICKVYQIIQNKIKEKKKLLPCLFSGSVKCRGIRSRDHQRRTAVLGNSRKELQEGQEEHQTEVCNMKGCVSAGQKSGWLWTSETVNKTAQRHKIRKYSRYKPHTEISKGNAS